MVIKIKVCEPVLKGNERKYVNEVLDSTMISSMGPMVNRFELAFAHWLYGSAEFDKGRAHATTTTSGTSALNLAMHTLRIGGNYGGKYNDEVIIPDFTMIAVPNCVHWSGARPILVDVEWDTFNINARNIKPYINKHTKAVIVTHTYGVPNRLEEIKELCDRYNIYLIEDGAEGLGATSGGKKVGTYGDISTFSLYANKLIVSGEGGMVTSRHKRIIERAFFLKNHTFSTKQHFWHNEIGHNYRMTALQAAVGLAQLEQINTFIEARQNNAKLYDKYIEEMDRVEPMPNIEGSVYWMYGVRLIDIDKQKVREYLEQKGIETRSFFVPVHMQKPYLQPDNMYPASMDLYKRGFYLPSGSGLEPDEIKYVCDMLKEAIKEVGKDE